MAKKMSSFVRKTSFPFCIQEKKHYLCANKTIEAMAKRDRTYISFDWALKRLLRDKANFDVLEGFLSTLLNEPITISSILESESNRDREDSKQNRVDLLASNDKGELFLIEVQGENEFAYFQRMLFGASRLVTEYIEKGENYDHVKKVYSINIVYFDIRQAEDVVYHGKTEFRGIHTGELLQLSQFQRQQFDVSEIYELYPEYYILKVNDFNRWSKVPLDQWLYFLATSEIPDDASAPGLQEAREKLRLSRMSRQESLDYDRYWMDRHILTNQMFTARGEARLEGLAEGRAEGREEGREEGRAQGRAEERAKVVVKMHQHGMTPEQIATITDIPLDEVNQIISA